MCFFRIADFLWIRFSFAGSFQAVDVQVFKGRARVGDGDFGPLLRVFDEARFCVGTWIPSYSGWASS